MKRKYNKLTPTEKAALIDQLNSTANMQDFLFLLAAKFDLQHCQPGSITKKILSQQMVSTVLPMINPDEK